MNKRTRVSPRRTAFPLISISSRHRTFASLLAISIGTLVWVWTNNVGALAAANTQAEPTPTPAVEGLAVVVQDGVEVGVAKVPQAGLEGALRAPIESIQVASLEIPSNCVVQGLYTAPRGAWAGIQFSCESGGHVTFADMRSSQLREPEGLRGRDQIFLAWAPNGSDAVIRVDAVIAPQILRVHLPDGEATPLNVPPSTYALAYSPDGERLIYATTDGVGWGSELWTANPDGADAVRLLEDRSGLVTAPRWSPDGTSLAFVSIPDGMIPFTVGELWVVDGNGANLRPLASADAGHGFAPVWSPDSQRIAFVVRENPQNPDANIRVEALKSNVYAVSIEDGVVVPLTDFKDTLVGAPFPSPDGALLAVSTYEAGRTVIWLRGWDGGTETQVLDQEGRLALGWMAGD